MLIDFVNDNYKLVPKELATKAVLSRFSKFIEFESLDLLGLFMLEEINYKAGQAMIKDFNEMVEFGPDGRSKGIIFHFGGAMGHQIISAAQIINLSIKSLNSLN